MTIQQQVGAGIAAVSWFAAACGAAGYQATASSPAAVQREVTPPRAVVCLAAVSDGVRVYRLHEADLEGGARREWRLTMTEPASKRPPLVVSLPGAVPVVTAGNVRLAYRSRNGGLVLALDSSGAGASLDISVKLDLAVHDDAPLTPEINRFDTRGAVRLPPCRVEAS